MDKIIRFPEAVSVTGLSKATLYRMLREGQFVPRVQISERNVGFRQSEVDTWIQSRQRA